MGLVTLLGVSESVFSDGKWERDWGWGVRRYSEKIKRERAKNQVCWYNPATLAHHSAARRSYKFKDFPG